MSPRRCASLPFFVWRPPHVLESFSLNQGATDRFEPRSSKCQSLPPCMGWVRSRRNPKPPRRPLQKENNNRSQILTTVVRLRARQQPSPRRDGKTRMPRRCVEHAQGLPATALHDGQSYHPSQDPLRVCSRKHRQLTRFRPYAHPGSGHPEWRMILRITASMLKPARLAAAAKPASGERHGFTFTSRIHGRPSSSTRKSTRA
jgi:hypothetical protein